MTTAASAKTAATSAPDTDRGIYNFSAGPGVLPESVLRRAQSDLWDIEKSGIGIMEHSHRGKIFDRVIDEAEADCRTLAGIGDDYAVLFLQGGASGQFAMIPMNFLASHETADYANTGVWAKKAAESARYYGKVHLSYDGAKAGYDHCPSLEEWTTSEKPVYVHYCSNNTIYGTRFAAPPSASAPLIVDTSSEMFSRPIDVQKHALIYAGAQKNLGPAGVTLVIIRRDLLEHTVRELPPILTYSAHAKEGSRLNTPPTFPIYVMGQVFKWIIEQGGLEAIERRNEEKAAVIYRAVDDSGGFYKGVARPDCRSTMNVTFRTPSEELDARFVKEAAAAGFDGLKGHRNAGGLRASIYNAFPASGCTALAEFMREFARRG
jgi:phosphoserine aminotransferase